MSNVYFSTNPSDYPKLEGLYVAEQNPPGFIQGVALNTVGFAGKCVRGPLVPTEITSTGRFLEVFGGRDKTANGTGGVRIGEVHGALCNKKFGKIVVRRVAASDATKANHTFSDAVPTAIMRIDASSVGSWGAGVTAAVVAATDGDANHFNLQVTYQGKTVIYQNLDLHNGSDNSAAIIGTDDARLIDIVKLVDGRPVNASSALATAGSDGTLAVTDYNAGINDLAAFPGVQVVLTPEVVAGSVATFHSNLVTLAATVSDRVFLTWAQAHGVAVATEAAQVTSQITTRTDRIWWCKNSPYTIDPDTGAEAQTAPHVWLASILSQTDVDVHPGSYDNIPLLAGVTRLTETALTRDDLIALKAAGISTIERDPDGFLFRSAVTTSLASGKTEQTRRRACDYLQLSASSRLRSNVKAKNTRTRRAQIASELTAFSREDQKAEHVVEEFAIDQVSVNNPTDRGQGTEKLLWTVKLIDHILALVLETDIATGITIEKAA
jgi:hypothetical protein